MAKAHTTIRALTAQACGGWLNTLNIVPVDYLRLLLVILVCAAPSLFDAVVV